MRVIKPQRIDMMHVTLPGATASQLAVTGMFAFRLDKTAEFCTDQEMWDVIKPQMGPSGIFDLWMPKPAGEVLLWGCAATPQPVARMAVALQCGPLSKRLVVHGDRHWQPGPFGWRASPAQAFTSMPLQWERSFGGPRCVACPVGVGMDGMDRLDAGEIAPLPNIEAVDQPMLHPEDTLAPVGFAPIDPTWPAVAPRGTFDHAWLARQYPAMPDDFDWTVYNRAQPDQRLSGFWQGDEALLLEGMHAAWPRLASALPQVQMRCFSARRSGEGLQDWPMRIDTVCLFPAALMGVLLFRTVVPDVGPDARGIDALMLAAEWRHSPKPVEHYALAYRLRTDAATKMQYAMADLQLMPELTPDQQAGRDGARENMRDALQQQADVRHQARSRQAAAAMGMSAASLPLAAEAAGMAGDDLDFPVITDQDVALGEVDLNGVKRAAERMQAQAMQQLDAWQEQAQALPSHDEAATAIAEDSAPHAQTGTATTVAPAAAAENHADMISPAMDMSSQIDALADSVANDQDTPLEQILKNWIMQHTDNAPGLEDIMATGGVNMMQAAGPLPNDPETRARLVQSLRDSAQAMDEGMARMADVMDNPEAALDKLPAGLRDLIDKIDADDPSALLAVGLTGGDLAALMQGLAGQAAVLPGANTDALKAWQENLPQVQPDAQHKSMLADQVMSMLPADVITLENLNALTARLAGQSDGSNPLIDALGKALTASAGEEAANSFLTPHAALPALAEELAAAQEDMADHRARAEQADDTNLNAMLPEMIMKTIQGEPLDRDTLLRMLDEGPNDAAQLAARGSAPAAPEQDDLPGAAQSALADDTSPLAEDGATDALEQIMQVSEQAQTSEAAPTADMAGAAAGTSAAFMARHAQGVSQPTVTTTKAADGLTSARRSARGRPLQRANLPAGAAAEMGAALLAAHAQGTSFQGRDLAGIDWRNADLRGVDLRGALLEGADLTGADLSGAQCSDATLTGANLQHANLSSADFSRANVSGVQAQHSTWEGADLSGAVLAESDFSYAAMRRVRLDRCDARQALFQHADLSGSQCDGGRLQQANLDDARLQGAHWHKADLMEARLSGCQAQGAKLINCMMVSVEGEAADFAHACLDQSNLIDAQLRRLHAPGLCAQDSSWHGSDLTGAVFDQASLQKAHFMEAQMEQVSLVRAQLKEAVLSGAQLQRAILSDAQLFGAALRAVDATGADLRGANLRSADVSGAQFDQCDFTGTDLSCGLLAKTTDV